MKGAYLLSSLLILVISQHTIATGRDQRPSNHPQLIDFFGKGKANAATVTEQNHHQDRQDRLTPSTSPSLDLSLSLQHQQAARTFNEPPSSSSLAGKSRRYTKYQWQRDLDTDSKVEQVYRNIGVEWDAMPHSTVLSSLTKIDRLIEKKPALIYPVLKQDKAAIEYLAQQCGPSTTILGRNRRAKFPRHRMPLTVAELLNRRNARPAVVESMIGYTPKERKAPKWGKNLTSQDKDKLIDRLADEWKTSIETVKSRLYSFKPEILEKHFKYILNDDPVIYKRHAEELLGNMARLRFGSASISLSKTPGN